MLKRFFLIVLFLIPASITNADQPRTKLSNPNVTRTLENVLRFRVPPKPENWWEGTWCYNGGYKEAYAVAAFVLDGGRSELSREAHHPGTGVFLFMRDNNGDFVSPREERLVQVVWDEGGSDTFRLRFMQLRTEIGHPDLTYVHSLVDFVSGIYGTAQDKRVQYVKTRNIDECLRSLNNLEPCECSVR